MDVDEVRRLVEVERLSYQACAAALAQRRPELRDPEWLREQTSRTVPDVADELGVHPVTVTEADAGMASHRSEHPIDVDEASR